MYSYKNATFCHGVNGNGHEAEHPNHGRLAGRVKAGHVHNGTLQYTVDVRAPSVDLV